MRTLQNRRPRSPDRQTTRRLWAVARNISLVWRSMFLYMYILFTMFVILSPQPKHAVKGSSLGRIHLKLV